MRTKKYKVYLAQADRQKLLKITSKGNRSAKIIKRANILLALDENQGKPATQEEIAEQFHATTTLIHTVSKQLVEQGIDATVSRKKRETPPTPPIATGEIEAKIIQIACSQPPEGKTWWTLVMIEDEMGRLGIKISDNTVGRVLKKHRLNHTKVNTGAYHPSKTLAL